MQSKNVKAEEPVTSPEHWGCINRMIYDDDRATIREVCIYATGGAEPHAHNFDSVHVFYVLEGALKVICNGETKIFPAGYSFWFAPGETHQVLGDGEQDAKYIVINAPSFNSFRK